MKSVSVVICVVFLAAAVSAFDRSKILHDIDRLQRDIFREKEASSEVFLQGEGDPGQPCKGGSGICKDPASCSGQVVSGKCNGGADNKCCVEGSSSASAAASSASSSSDDEASATSAPSAPSAPDAGSGVLSKDGWNPPAFVADPNFSAPSPCPSKPAMPDVEKLRTDDAQFASALGRIAESRADWSKGKEDKAKATELLAKDWKEYSQYIINRIAMRQKNKKNECTVATFMNNFIPKVKKGFLCAMYNKARFDYLPQNASPSPVAKPSGEPELVSDEAVVGGSSGGQKVAKCVMDIVRQLKTRTPTGAGTYVGHSWGPYSVDFFPNAELDDCKFYNKDKAVAFLDALHKLSQEKGFKWRCLYDDFDVAKRFNEKNRVKKVSYVKYHGPDPFVLHFHCDFNC